MDINDHYALDEAHRP